MRKSIHMNNLMLVGILSICFTGCARVSAAPYQDSYTSSSSTYTPRPSEPKPSDDCNAPPNKLDECFDTSSLRKMAEQGDLEAQLHLGHYYISYVARNGNRTPNDVEALRWFEMAAAQGDVAGQFASGYLYKHGFDWNSSASDGKPHVDINYTKALQYFHMADQATGIDSTNYNISEAEYEIGDCYENGLGIKKDHTEAMKWFNKAAGNNNRDAISFIRNEDGIVEKKKIEEARIKLITPIIEAGKHERDRFAKTLNKDDSSSSKPDREHALAQINDALQGDGFAITDLKYDNGYADGQQYVVVATWKKTFTISYDDAAKQADDDAKSRKDAGALFMNIFAGYAVNKIYGNFKAGDAFNERRQFRFMRTEKGWMRLAS